MRSAICVLLCLKMALASDSTLPKTPSESKASSSNITLTTTYPNIDQAIARNDLADVRRHVSQNPEVIQGGAEKTRPPLSQAILRNKPEIALFLLEAGSDPNWSDASQRTLLHLAVERNNAELVKALLKSGAKADGRDQGGWTPLHHAAAKNLLSVAKALLEGGAKPMTLSELGGTPLHEAAVSGEAALLQLLIDHGVDMAVISKEGVTALDLAKKYKNAAAIEFFSKRTASAPQK